MPDTSSSEPRRRPGNVYAFVSAKGGTGKSIMAATTAYLLLKCKRKVLAIDADFSTRGLSLYLLGRAVEQKDVVFHAEHCLADAFFAQLPISQLQPKSIVRDLVEFHVLLSNRELYRGGVPDERMLGGASEALQTVTPSPEEFTDYLVKLCQRFRNEYDDIIIDTRGGFDFTSAGPACAADGYIVVLEADAISRDQVGGLMTKIDDFGKAHSLRPALKGFIVNKALFALDTLFPDELRRLYGGRTFGVIPSDRDAIRAYQKKDIPAEVSPDSDFAYYSLQVVENIAAPAENEWEPDQRARFDAVKGVITREWTAQRRLSQSVESLPYAHIVLIAAAATFYAGYRGGAASWALTGFYVTLGLAVLGATASSLLVVLRAVQRRPISHALKLATASAMVLALIAMTYVGSTDVPRAFSRDALLSRVQQQDATITQLNAELSKSKIAALDATTQIEILRSDLSRANAEVHTAQNERDKALQALSTTKEQLAAVQRSVPKESQSSSRPPLRLGFIAGPCTVVVLFNQTATYKPLKGWRLDAVIAGGRGFGVPLDAEDVRPYGSASLYGGSACERGVQNAFGSGRSFDQLAALASMGNGELRLIDPSGAIADSVRFVTASAAKD